MGSNRMKQKRVCVLIGILVVCVIGTGLFYVCQGILDSQREEKYLDVYRNKAVEYVRTDPIMLEKYGENIAVQFDSVTRYKLSGERSFFDTIKEVFGVRTPDTIEEFVAGIEWIRFYIAINRDEYEITFAKNAQGELIVSSLISME